MSEILLCDTNGSESVEQTGSDMKLAGFFDSILSIALFRNLSEIRRS